MRELTSHKVPGGATADLEINVMDEPGDGGACHAYSVYGFCTDTNPSAFEQGRSDETAMHVHFQDGTIPENGVNGVTNEVLLAIVEDRLLGFQSGPFACRENSVALTKIQEAMMWLQKRTRDRIARGVEGTHTV